MSIRIFLTIFCALHSIPALAAEPLSIAVARSPLSLPLYIAEHEAYFAAEGVQVRLDDIIGGHRALQALLEGKSDMATVSETGFMFQSFRHKEMVILASFVSSNDDIKLVTRADSGIESVSDLAGKRVGITHTTSSHYLLDTLVILSGGDPARVHSVNMQAEAMQQALLNGEVAAVAVWEPFPFQILDGIANARIVTAPRFYTLTFNLVASRNITATGRDDDLVRLLRALERAQHFIATQPKRAQAIMQSRLGLEQSFIDWIWPRYNYRLALDQSLLATLESEARWARTQGHVKADRSPNYLEFIYADPLRKALPGAVSIAN